MSPLISCLTETVTKLAFYAVVAYGIHASKVVVITYITSGKELNELLGFPRNSSEVATDEARRMGLET